MKFTKNRLLSLLLVLAMMLALVPTVFAAHTGENHTMGEWQTDSTTGKHYRECTAEGCTEREEHVPAGTWTTSGENHTRTCTVEGCTKVDTHAANWSAWTLDSTTQKHTRTCATCNTSESHDPVFSGQNALICSATGCNYSKIASVGAVTLTPATVTAAATMPISDASTANDAKARF